MALNELITKTEKGLAKCSHRYLAEDLERANELVLERNKDYERCLECPYIHWSQCPDYISLSELIEFYKLFRKER